MKKTLLILCGAMALAITSCNQAPAEPTAEEIDAKVQSLYGPALETQKQVKQMECAATIDATVADRLKAATAAPVQ